MTSGRRIGGLGSGSVSRSLGASDPRSRRNAQVALEARRNIDESLDVDARQRLGVKKSTGVAAIADTATATTADVAEKLNEIIAAMRAAGHMEDES